MFFFSSAHCFGVSGTLESGGFFSSLISPIFGICHIFKTAQSYRFKNMILKGNFPQNILIIKKRKITFAAL